MKKKVRYDEIDYDDEDYNPRHEGDFYDVYTPRPRAREHPGTCGCEDYPCCGCDM